MKNLNLLKMFLFISICSFSLLSCDKEDTDIMERPVYRLAEVPCPNQCKGQPVYACKWTSTYITACVVERECPKCQIDQEPAPLSSSGEI